MAAQTTPSFLWHDYETFGREPRRDRPSQFAAVRTDMDLQEIDEAVMHFCQPANDFLPDPEACLLTGITPQQALSQGLPEPQFAARVHEQLARAGTIGVGYNSIRFDDEVTRFLCWRNLIEPYAREFRNDCGRWDLLDVVRLCYALRPGHLSWPKHESGRPSFKLEHLTQANGLAHAHAHDALSDVRATIGLARLIKTHHPKLWAFALKLRRKEAVAEEIAAAQARGEPLLHVSGRYAAERGCLALVWPLSPHPLNKNELILWDLSVDPTELWGLNAATVRERLFAAAPTAAGAPPRLPIKTLHLNRSPMVVANLNVLGPELVERWTIDLDQARRHAALLAERVPSLAGLWPEVYQKPTPMPVDVDEDLYGGFVSDQDRRLLDRVRTGAPGDFTNRQPMFQDDRLDELVFRYRARNFADSLSEDEAERWAMTRVAKLVDGEGGARTLESYFASLEALKAERGEGDAKLVRLLDELSAYGAAITP